MTDVLNFKIVESPAQINSDWVLARVSPEQIFYAYFGSFIPYKKAYRSVFRKDNNPSTGFYINNRGILKYRDFVTDESWDCFSFVGQLYGLRYYEAVKKVGCDFGLIKCEGVKVEKKKIDDSFKFDKKSKESAEIQIIPGKWTRAHIDYMKSYKITQEDIVRDHAYVVDKLFLNKRLIRCKEGELRFAYEVKTPLKSYLKIYSPFAEKDAKWLSNIPLHIPFGMDTLNYDSETILATKSWKDMVVLKKLFPSVIGLQNESEAALSEGLMKHLHKKFKKRIIIFDNDGPGVKNCIKLNEKGFGYWNVPKDYLIEGIKDPADVVKCYGLDKLKQLFQQKNLI